MATRVTIHVALTIGLLVVSGSAQAQQTPPPAYQLAAAHADVPATILFAVALQESGMTLRGRFMPWPWTLNIAGRAHRYSNRTETCSALRYALQQLPGTRVDVGLGQINVGYHGHRVDEPCQLIDPYRNLMIAASLLREHHTPGGDWLMTVGHYHRPAGGAPAERYRRSVEQHLHRVTGSIRVIRSSSISP
jgi:hypothetical protein